MKQPMHTMKIKNFTQNKINGYGYIITLDNKKYYIAGDTDNIEEIQNIKCDFAFLPVGGTYTMTYEEAAELANVIKAKTVIPTHYGCIVGDKEDGKRFAKLVKEKEVRY